MDHFPHRRNSDRALVLLCRVCLSKPSEDNSSASLLGRSTYVNSEIVRGTIDVSDNRDALREMFQDEFRRFDGHRQFNHHTALITFEGKALARQTTGLENHREGPTLVRRLTLTLIMISGCFDMCTMGIPRNFTTFCRGSSVYSVQRVSTTFAPEECTLPPPAAFLASLTVRFESVICLACFIRGVFIEQVSDELRKRDW